MAANDNIAHLQQRMDRMPAHTNGKGGPPTEPRRIIFRHISEIVAEQREPEWLIDDIIEAKVLGVLAGPRGVLKSFVATDWAMNVAADGHPCLILSAEGSDLGNRAEAWMNQHREGMDVMEIPVHAHERAINLNSIVELEELRTVIVELPARPALVIIDTFSKFSAGIDENSNGEVAAFLAGLSSLRDEFGCTVLLVAHSGHGDAKRPRGANALMSNPDCEYIVERNGMSITVTRDRFKSTPALPPLAYEAKEMDLGRTDKRGRPVTSLALVRSEAPEAPTPAKGRGRNQDKMLVALKEWHRTHPDAVHIATMDVREICKAQSIDRKRQREVLDTFVNARILTPAMGGYTLHGENL